MNQNSQNPFSMWMEMNKNAFDVWNNWISQAAPQTAKSADSGSENVNPMNAYYDFFMKSLTQNPVFSYMTSGDTGNMLEQMQKQWQENMRNMSLFIPNKAVKDGFERFMSSYQMFSGLQNFWETFLKGMPKDITDWNAFTGPIMKYYQDLTGGFMQPFMPEQIKGMFTLPLENFSFMQTSFTDFFKPWLEDSVDMQGQLLSALQGDKEAYAIFLKSWTETYKNSYAKLLNMPTVGANRASVEKMMKLLDYYVNFVVKLNEYTMLVSTMLTETMEKLLTHLAELQAEGKMPQTFMEFYNIWSKFNEKAFEDMYATDEFSKIMNDTVGAGSKLKVLYDDFMQDVLSFLPLPNRRELDSVEEEIYNLRKKVKAQEKEIKSLKEQMPAPAKDKA